jgi:hypothetical protein
MVSVLAGHGLPRAGSLIVVPDLILDQYLGELLNRSKRSVLVYTGVRGHK